MKCHLSNSKHMFSYISVSLCVERTRKRIIWRQNGIMFPFLTCDNLRVHPFAINLDQSSCIVKFFPKKKQDIFPRPCQEPHRKQTPASGTQETELITRLQVCMGKLMVLFASDENAGDEKIL